ncbi:cation:proton antiporter [Paractinoplanes deccanensis]|uniref:cation:proton antiporter n=1 Tax=Paractinoplanes deccanensis TaxID=113561 RepID=UPI001944F4C2|nr:cation:proton antiporter [Actinoplanes deccanensis]
MGWFPAGRGVVGSAMTAGAVMLIALAVFAWGVASRRLERLDLTAPMVFVAVGVLLAVLFDVDQHAEGIMALTEATLVWVLFSDASRVGPRELRGDAGVYGRLLGLALPLTVIAGTLLAWWLLGLPNPWPALLVGAALAPTDAALGSVVIAHPKVPARIRRILNVESGVNDGIVTPVVMVALAGAASGAPLLQLVGGAVIGAAIGAVGGRLLRTAGESFAGPAVLALALLAYAGSIAVHANGFVAAFAAGLAFGHVAGRGGPREVFYVEQTAGLASLLVWAAFGALAVPLLPSRWTWPMLLYALLSLTAVRMLPVALSLIGARFKASTVLFVGWFGPRGLASIVFALLAVEELGPSADTAVAVIVLTVLISVVAHGLSAGPLAARYGQAARAEQEPGPVAAARLHTHRLGPP